MDFWDDGFSLILMYLVGGLAGTIYETLLYLVKRGRFVYSSGSVFTPFNFVYGTGATMICLVLGALYEHPVAVYFVGALLGTVVEYVLSFLEEKLLHMRSWDYSYMRFNINGRVALRPTLIWGLICLIVLYGVYVPLMQYVIQPYVLSSTEGALIYHIVLLVMLFICIVDLGISVMALFRYQRRQRGTAKDSRLGRAIDRVFNDKYMASHFENAKLRDEEAVNSDSPV